MSKKLQGQSLCTARHCEAGEAARPCTHYQAFHAPSLLQILQHQSIHRGGAGEAHDERWGRGRGAPPHATPGVQPESPLTDHLLAHITSPTMSCMHTKHNACQEPVLWARRWGAGGFLIGSCRPSPIAGGRPDRLRSGLALHPAAPQQGALRQRRMNAGTHETLQCSVQHHRCSTHIGVRARNCTSTLLLLACGLSLVLPAHTGRLAREPRTNTDARPAGDGGDGHVTLAEQLTARMPAYQAVVPGPRHAPPSLPKHPLWRQFALPLRSWKPLCPATP